MNKFIYLHETGQEALPLSLIKLIYRLKIIVCTVTPLRTTYLVIFLDVGGSRLL